MNQSRSTATGASSNFLLLIAQGMGIGRISVAPGTFGSMGRNDWSGPGQFRIDLGVSRWINLNERFKLQIRGDSYNFTNSPFFSNPQTDRNNSSFGYVTGTNSSGSGVNGFSASRSVQLAMKVMF